MHKILFIALLSIIIANAESVQTVSTEMISSPNGRFVDDNRSSSQIAVVFYRLDGDKNHIPTVKVGINVVGSLLPNHYATTKACKNKLLLGVAERGDVINVTHNDLSNINNITNTIYVKVNEMNSDKRFSLSLVEPHIAKNEISSLQVHSNIINRHIPKCEILETPKVFKSITIDIDALFDFDDSRLRKEAAENLSKVLKEIKENEIYIKSITVVGFTDRLGDANYNLALSKKRANSVVKYLRKHSSIKEIKGVGRGENNPVSRGCDKLNGVNLKSCLQPDRRVVVIDMIMK